MSAAMAIRARQGAPLTRAQIPVHMSEIVGWLGRMPGLNAPL